MVPALVALALPVHAQPRLSPGRAAAPITLDGVLDPAEWAGGVAVRGMLSALPDVGRPDPDTEIWLITDESAIYVGFKVHARKVASALVPRDQTLLQDWVEVVLDTWQDGRRAFVFRVNARGVQADGVYEDGDDLWNQDLSWDGVWRSAARPTEDGYDVELAIPWSTLRYSRAATQDWGVLLLRNTPVPYTTWAWPPLSQRAPSWLAQEALLGPLQPPPVRRDLSLLPTLTALDTLGGALRPGVSPFARDPNPSLSPGLDARLGLTHGLGLSLALNPDFSQIEADAAQITANIRYPLYYPEKRPFFLESADRFSTPLPLLYTRSVVDPLLGARLTGRAGRTGIGLLSALDQAPAPSTISVDYASGEALPGWDAATVEGASALVDVARVTRLVGAQEFGAFLADKELFVTDGATLGNHVGGLDASLRAGRYAGTAQALISQTDTATGGISGAAWTLSGARAGDRLSLQATSTGITPGFRAETGFLGEVGRYGGRLDAVEKFADLGPFRSLQPSLRALADLAPDGSLADAEAGAHLKATLGENLYGSLDADLRRERYLGEDFDLWGASGYAGYEPTPSTELGLGWKVGTTPWYDAPSADALFRGLLWQLSPYAHALVGGRADLSYEGAVAQLLRSAGEEVVETAWIHRGRLSVNFSRPLSLRVIEQVDTWARTWDSSAQIAWVQSYGTAAYLGVDETRGLDTLEPVERTAYARVGLLWTP